MSVSQTISLARSPYNVLNSSPLVEPIPLVTSSAKLVRLSQIRNIVDQTASNVRIFDAFTFPRHLIGLVHQIKLGCQTKIKGERHDACLKGTADLSNLVKSFAAITNWMVDLGHVTARSLVFTTPVMLVSNILAFTAGIWEVKGMGYVGELLKDIEKSTSDDSLEKLISELSKHSNSWLERRGLTDVFAKEIKELAVVKGDNNKKVALKNHIIERLKSKRTSYILAISVHVIAFAILGLFLSSVAFSAPALIGAVNGLYLVCLGITIAQMIYNATHLKDPGQLNLELS